jgi:phage-related protein
MVTDLLRGKQLSQDQVKLNLTLNTASTLIIDSQTRSATVDGSDRTGKFTREEWFGMMPGVNQIRLLADSTGVGATIALQYYDAWR